MRLPSETVKATQSWAVNHASLVAWRLREARQRLGHASALIARLRGRAGLHGPTLSVLCAGRQTVIDDLRRILCPEDCSVETLGDCPPLALWRGLERHRRDDDVLVADVAHRGLRPPETRYLVPLTLSAETEPGASYASYIENHVAQDLRRALKKANALGIFIREGSLRDELRAFYDTLLVPFARARHGDRAHLPTWDQVEGCAHRATLYLAEREGAVIAGYLLLTSPIRSRGDLWRLGIHPKAYNDSAVFKAVNTALFAHGLRRVCELGFRTYGLGLTMPVMNQGGFVFKRRWGSHFRAGPGCTVCVMQFCSAKRAEILEARPIVAMRGHRLLGLVGLSHDDPERFDAFRHCVRDSAFPGLEGFIAVTADRAALRARLRATPQPWVDSVHSVVSDTS